MWKHMARIVGEIRPRYVYVENSPMLTSRGLGTVLGDLAEMGFDAEWGVLGAADVGAPHQRDRIWIMAHSNLRNGESCNINTRGFSTRNEPIYKSEGHSIQFGNRSPSEMAYADSAQRKGNGISIRVQPQNTNFSCDSTNAEVSDTSSQRQQGPGQPVQRSSSAQNGERETNLFKPICVGEFWRVEPNVGRVADGVAARVDRLKAIGNGQVSAVAATAWTILNKKRTAQKSSSVPRNAQVSEQKE
jgi:DNA (cytosine-5)-methyltransferase 1